MNVVGTGTGAGVYTGVVGPAVGSAWTGCDGALARPIRAAIVIAKSTAALPAIHFQTFLFGAALVVACVDMAPRCAGIATSWGNGAGAADGCVCFCGCVMATRFIDGRFG